MHAEIDEIVQRLIYGDIEDVSLAVLGEDCPSPERLAEMDDEQRLRLAAAATVRVWLDDRGRLHA